MAMEKLKEEVKAITEAELNRANKNFPLFNSKHEGYAVIKEELEETREALEEAETVMECIWEEIRGKRQLTFISPVNPDIAYDQCINIACEAIQTAAMLLKYDMSLSDHQESEDQDHE